jgi:hypothetical protein
MSAESTEHLARQRLEAAERRLARTPSVTLARTGRAFWRYPSPWMIAGFLVTAVAARVLVGGWAWTDLLAPVVFLAIFPLVEWVIHVFVLHWRPRRVAGVEVDTLLARDHRRHHADPRDVPLVFIPWRALVWVIALPGTALPLLVGGLLGVSMHARLSSARPIVLRGDPGGRAVRLRVDALRHPLRLQAADPRLPGGLAQPPAAPLQERALLVLGDHVGHERPAAGDLPRPGLRADEPDRQGPARPSRLVLTPEMHRVGAS